MTESILLVDDNPTNLQMLMQTLRPTGCRLLAAKSGEAALGVCEKSRPDLILLDIMMPGIDGYEVCRRLKASPETEHIPVIFLSSLDETSDKVKGLELGAVDYVSKPFQPEEVIARVNTHLTIHRLSREVQAQKDQLEHELVVVSALQRSLLPAGLPRIAGVRLGVRYETSRYAGGDYYDVSLLDDGRCCLLIADAEGHSAPATVMMAMACALFRSCPAGVRSPDAVLSHINTNLCKVNQESFVTACCSVLDAVTGRLVTASAGHPAPLVYRRQAGATETLTCKPVCPLGLDEYKSIPVHETVLAPGDRLLLFTDGVTERFNPAGDLYGESRLRAQLARADADDPEVLLTGVMEDLERFSEGRPPDDDESLLLVAREPG